MTTEPTCNHCHHHPHSSEAPRPTAAVPSDVEYTCPMHPEVVQMGPGTCPECGMALEPKQPSLTEEDNPELRDMTRRFWLSFALTLPVFGMAMAEMLPLHLNRVLSPTAQVWLQLVLATPVVLWGGWPFFRRGWASLVRVRLNMFTLIALGTTAAYGYSLVATFLPGLFPPSFRGHGGHVAVYFEAAAVITTLVLLGQVLELRARSRTSEAIKALLRLAPETARLVEASGAERDIPLEHVHVGYRLRVRPGDKVPVDGEIEDGKSYLDESMVTGESAPVSKGPGDEVIGGTLNGSGGFIMRAQRVGQETMLAQIVRMVSDAQRSRAPIQRLADLVAAWFVPAVMAVAVVTFAVWFFFGPQPAFVYGLVNAVAVLIIACPCALGLATPMSIMVGTGRGATLGVLIKSAEALETLERVDTLVVDKTGTLTEGKPALTSVFATPTSSEQEVLRLAGSLERASEHPLGAAIVAGAGARGIALFSASDFESITGKGIRGRVDGREVMVGNASFVETAASIDPQLRATAESHQREGETVMYVALQGEVLGILGVSDPIKASAAAALAALRDEGLRIVMLTGDNQATAQAVARKLALEEVVADVVPQQKSDTIAQLKREGRVVAMAGDGVNDAPALAMAHVGIAMGSGTDVAVQSAGVTLLHGDLMGIVRARRLSRATMRNIRQNLFFAFVYNGVGVPVAAGLLYPWLGLLLSPMIASAAMSLSSVSVIANALRLRKVSLS